MTTPTATETATDALVAFISARLDEDERYLKSNAHHLWTKRPLREVEFKRQILEMHAEYWRLWRSFEAIGEPGSISLGRAQALTRMLPRLAAVWSDHPDCRPEWKTAV